MTSRAETRHPIGVVAERTGLSPDVLRVWERRYNVVKPGRSPGGQRVYSDSDIERLSLLHRATQGGHGISHVASLDTEDLQQLVREAEVTRRQPVQRLTSADETEAAVQEALAFAEALDPASLEGLLKRRVARYGIARFVDSIAAPFLRAVGDRWHEGKLTIAQEHLATAVVQRVVTDTAPLLTGASGNPTIVIATLEGERHGNGALMAAATAASEGWRVIYLGADLPAREIAESATRAGARAVGISMVLSDRKTRAAHDLRQIEQDVSAATRILVGGKGAAEIRRTFKASGIVFVESMEEMRAELALIRRQ